MEKFSGVVILTTNMLSSIHHALCFSILYCFDISLSFKGIDNAFFRRLKYVIEFPIPKPNLRAKLWRVHIPEGERGTRDGG